MDEIDLSLATVMEEMVPLFTRGVRCGAATFWVPVVLAPAYA